MLNFEIGGDRTENVLWHSNDLLPLPSVKQVVVLCGTNNFHENLPTEIADGLNDFEKKVEYPDHYYLRSTSKR